MEPVLAALRDAAERGLMPEGASVLLAVSGGADSMALLFGAAETASRHGWRLAIGHVHHGWRGREADRDLAFVREHARRLGIPFDLRRRDARGEARTLKLSPEAGARHARYAALREMAAAGGAELIATAHQREDCVETYLLARERGAGLAGLAGLQRRRSDGVVRPLLGVSRREILAFLSERGLAHRRDASNGDLHLPRNRIRRAVAVLLAERGEEALRKLEAEIERLSLERDALEEEFTRSVEPRILRGAGTAMADAPYLQACGDDIQRLAIERAALPFARPGRPPLTGREREQILVRLRGGSDFRFEAGRRIRFDRRGPVLRIGLAPARTAEASNPGQ
jgi:tRNA(Ile)-lysidine synthase